MAALAGGWLIAGVQLGLPSSHGVIALRVSSQPLGQQRRALDAVTGRDRLAELSDKVVLRGQQQRVPGGSVQLSSRAPVLPGENAPWEVCVERVQVRPVEEELEGKQTNTRTLKRIPKAALCVPGRAPVSGE